MAKFKKKGAVKKMVGTRMPAGVAMGAAPMGGGFPGAAPPFKKGGKAKKGGA